MQMNLKSYDMLRRIPSLLILFVSLMMMGCASGIQRIEGPPIERDVVQAVRDSCKNNFAPAESGFLGSLWENKRAILKQSRSCSIAAQTLAQQVEARNNTVGK
jgi:hypothetical protein